MYWIIYITSTSILRYIDIINRVNEDLDGSVYIWKVLYTQYMVNSWKKTVYWSRLS